MGGKTVSSAVATPTPGAPITAISPTIQSTMALMGSTLGGLPGEPLGAQPARASARCAEMTVGDAHPVEMAPSH
ncbi:hypothetical protein GCM10025862_42430 [Arsenicicoccus piscis]|uniref:Uncharacterized protein n=1 Tax=Arsenicicoccus piscis TaxID=673954 RepID=A0ABQ6HUZ3_9MICO|nr:hypothetical protein GCM10025862_35300 [Arsenicicoccus piscis]GMA22172.1 hypothetical protein GCM10025862_41950 [Arsenicicoccus piscis]GMA22220.1 hypothetical protein GCM10025862_42430 [Arsenicicoccus piscis]